MPDNGFQLKFLARLTKASPLLGLGGVIGVVVLVFSKESVIFDLLLFSPPFKELKESSAATIATASPAPTTRKALGKNKLS